MNARAWRSSETSVGSATARPPSSSIRLASASMRSVRRAASATAAPASAQASAVASPIPDEAPVMATVRPWRSIPATYRWRLQPWLRAVRPGRTPAYDHDARRSGAPCHGQRHPATRQLPLRRGLRPGVRRASLHLQRAGLFRALRAGGREARLRRRAARRPRARGPRQPRRQRRDPRPRVGAGRARQRLLARTDRRRGSLARPLVAAAGVPKRLARPAREGGRARRRVRRRGAELRLPPTRSRWRADRARARAELLPGRVTGTG